MKKAIVVGIVRASVDVRKKATLNSFQTPMNMRIAVAAMPPAISGSVIKRKALKREAPSTIADSSNSIGMPSTKPRIIQMA